MQAIDLQTTYDYGIRTDGGTHGLVLTKPHIVELILDLVGYSTDSNLPEQKILDPCCGEGIFLVHAAHRLMQSIRGKEANVDALSDAIRGYDIDPRHVEATRVALTRALHRHDLPEHLSVELPKRWIQQADFLLTNRSSSFDFIVGNPPYVRIEQLSSELQSVYRKRFATLFDRADLYVAFIEQSLSLLSRDGRLGFICADRWILNRYGAPLRKLITENFSIKTYVDLHQASPFETDVIAYPAIFVVQNSEQSQVSVYRMSEGTPEECLGIRQSPTVNTSPVDIYEKWFHGEEPWILTPPDRLRLLRSLEDKFPLLEETSARVRIGIATGNDATYIVRSGADIEPDRLIPLVMRADIRGGQVFDGDRFVINTYDSGGPISLEKFPRLRRYLDSHASKLKSRHIATKSTAWFKTIDRPYPDMVPKPKLLIPDIAGSNEVVYEDGHFYPHHNLYFILSDEWDLEVLGGLLSSKVALFFIWSYAVKMRGGYLRFQAQYLRKIRVPRSADIPEGLAGKIKAAFRDRDFAALDQLALEAYGLEYSPEFDFVDTRH